MSYNSLLVCGDTANVVIPDRWHPDLNKGSADSGRRFQAVTDAFEEIKRIHAGDEASRVRSLRYRGSSSTAGQYADSSYQRRSAQSFYGFRQSRQRNANFRGGYEGEVFVRRGSRGRRHESLHLMRSRVRMFESLGVGLGVFAIASVVSLAVIGTEVVWQSVNRGKSFEEVVREMQERPVKKYPGRRMRREGTGPRDGA